MRVAKIHSALCLWWGSFAVIDLLGTVFLLWRWHWQEGLPPGTWWAFFAFFSIMAVIHYFTSRGAKAGKHWANVASKVIAGMMLLGFPVGTLIAVFLLRYGNWKPQRKHFHGITDGSSVQSETGYNS
jgi:hypothetical protein